MVSRAADTQRVDPGLVRSTSRDGEEGDDDAELLERCMYGYALGFEA